MTKLPVIVVGGGPIGLVAASHLASRGIPFLLLEAGAPGAAITKWGHLRLFSPWRRNIDEVSAGILERTTDWKRPEPNYVPTGHELVSDYLEPLASCPSLSGSIQSGARAVSITRYQADRSSVKNRSALPFEVLYERQGHKHSALGRAVIDATGLMATPKPIGSNALTIPGESKAAAAGFITYGAPSPERSRKIGARILVIGAGHTAMQCIVGLAKSRVPGSLQWAIRQPEIWPLLRVEGSDRFPGRLALQAKARSTIADKSIEVIPHSKFERIDLGAASTLRMVWLNGEVRDYDHVVVATGYKPDYSLTSELQTAVDPVYECPAGMRKIIDVARGACAAVPVHGEQVLRHPEQDFYVAGMRSFGRASSFFLLAGYEQVRTIVAKLAGDDEASQPRAYMTMEEATLQEFLAEHPYYLETAFA